MSGQEYSKEALLGGSILKAMGKGFAKLNPIKGFKNMMRNRANRNRLPGQQITPNHLLAPRKVGTGTPFKNDGVPRKSTFKKATNGKIAWGTTPQQAASRGAQGYPATMSASQFSNKPPVTPKQKPVTPKQEQLKPPKPSKPVSTESPGGQVDTQQLQARIDKLEKKNKELIGDGKSNGMLSDMNKSYKKSALYKDFGYKPVVAGGALAAYSAGSSGGGAPVIVNN